MSFFEGLKAHFVEEKGLLGKQKKRAFDKLQNIKITTKKEYPLVKKKNVGIALDSFQHHLFPECPNYLLFLNGTFQSALSKKPAALSVLTLKEATTSFGGLLDLAITQKEELDPFALLNGAFFEEGAFLYVPSNTNIEEPLELLFIDQGEGLFFPKILLFLGKGASLKLAVKVVSNGSHFRSSKLDIFLEEASELKMATIEEKKESESVESIDVILKRNALFEEVFVQKGATLSKRTYRVSLEGEGAQAKIEGITSLTEKDENGIDICMHHKAPHTNSQQKIKGVLEGRSRSHFRGKIFIDPIAQKVEAYQLNNNLVLSEMAKAIVEPNLEIFADDVKASHGATVGDLDEELLFYFKSRGIEKEEAKKLLISGFKQEILEHLFLDSMRS